MTTTANTDQFIPSGNLETGIVDDGCEWGYGGCIGIGILTEDPFDRDVNDRISFTVMCGYCAGVRTDEASQPRH